MAIYFIDDDTGLDSDTGLSEALAWKTIDKAMNTVAAGDKVWVKNTNDYTETVTIDTAGTSTAWIIFEGYTSSTGDGGKFTIDGASSRANAFISALGNIYYRFENMIIENHTSIGFNGVSVDKGVFVNCEFNTNGNNGFLFDNGACCVNCIAIGNTTNGFESGIGGRYINCNSQGNTSGGFDDNIGDTNFIPTGHVGGVQLNEPACCPSADGHGG